MVENRPALTVLLLFTLPVLLAILCVAVNAAYLAEGRATLQNTADAAARSIVVVVDNASGGDAGGPGERKNRPVNKVAENAENFHVNGAVGYVRVPSDFADEIGHLVERERVDRIKQRPA